MKITRLLITIPLLLIMTGCSPPDARLHKMAERSLSRQAEQNQIVAQQSREVTHHTGNMIEADGQARQDVIELQRELVVSEAAARAELTALQQDLVERDAEGREALTTLQREVQAAVASEHNRIDQARDELEQERQQIALDRQRAPVVAAAIQSSVLLLACLAPLVLAGYLMHVLRHSSDGDAAVTEMLISEIATDSPRFLSRPAGPPMLPDTPSMDGNAGSTNLDGDAPADP